MSRLAHSKAALASRPDGKISEIALQRGRCRFAQQTPPTVFGDLERSAAAEHTRASNSLSQGRSNPLQALRQNPGRLADEANLEIPCLRGPGLGGADALEHGTDDPDELRDLFNTRQRTCQKPVRFHSRKYAVSSDRQSKSVNLGNAIQAGCQSSAIKYGHIAIPERCMTYMPRIYGINNFFICKISTKLHWKQGCLHHIHEIRDKHPSSLHLGQGCHAVATPHPSIVNDWPEAIFCLGRDCRRQNPRLPVAETWGRAASIGEPGDDERGNKRGLPLI